MKLSEIIAKYEPLGWQFEYTQTCVGDDFWTFKSPRMKGLRGFSEHIFEQPNPENMEINEEKMLATERTIFIYQIYNEKLAKQFDAVKKDILRQMEILDSKKVAIPNEMNISFDLKF